MTVLRRALDETSATALYLIPTCHNPTGSVMSEARRRGIARLVDEREIYLFEDETLADLVFDGNRPASIVSHTRSPLTVTIGSLSKTVWGGLRIGWLRASPDIADRAVRAKAAQDLGLSVAGQLLGLRALEALPEITSMRRAHRKDAPGRRRASAARPGQLRQPRFAGAREHRRGLRRRRGRRPVRRRSGHDTRPSRGADGTLTPSRRAAGLLAGRVGGPARAARAPRMRLHARR